MSDNILDEFSRKFCAVVEGHCRYIVVSGFVAISSGRARATEDIDIIIEKLDLPSFAKLHKSLSGAGFDCLQSEDAAEIYSYLTDKTSVRYTWRDRPLPEMELKMARDKVDEYQLATRTKLSLTGLDIWFSNINVNIAFKEGYLKSEKDLKDAEHLRKVYPELVSEDEIDKVKKMITEVRMR